MATKKPKKQRKVWEPTKEPGLFRYRPKGTYYSRTEIGGTSKRKRQDGDFSAAVEKHRCWIRNIRREAELAESQKPTTKSLRTWADWTGEFLNRINADPDIGIETRGYYAERVVGIRRTWPEIPGMGLRELTKDNISAYLAKVGETLSEDTIRGNLLVLRRVCKLAVSEHYLTVNPCDGIKGPAARRKLAHSAKHDISPAKFDEVLSTMRARKGGSSVKAADLAELLACTGARISEARTLFWKDINWEKRLVGIDGAKGRETSTDDNRRKLPFHPRLERLLLRLWGTGQPLTDRVVLCDECRASMKSACKRIGILPVHHHDLRHLAATWWIEAGIPIPTVAGLLGHKDGGALLMRTYHHMRSEHLAAIAGQMSR